jgi:hypothetical protein
MDGRHSIRSLRVTVGIILGLLVLGTNDTIDPHLGRPYLRPGGSSYCFLTHFELT